MRLTAKKRDEYIEIVRQDKYNKVVPINGKTSVEVGIAWIELAHYHFNKIMSDLDHVIKIKSLDHFEMLSHPETPLLLKDYLKHDDEKYLIFMKKEIERAQASLYYLTNAIDEEITSKNIKPKKKRRQYGSNSNS